MTGEAAAASKCGGGVRVAGRVHRPLAAVNGAIPLTVLCPELGAGCGRRPRRWPGQLRGAPTTWRRARLNRPARALAASEGVKGFWARPLLQRPRPPRQEPLPPA